MEIPQQGEQPQTAGRLKIFFSYASGAGKTYAMLAAARQVPGAVAGHIAPHAPPETLALLAGLEQLPGCTAPAFGLDAALARHPALLLVDELAHANPAGSRHLKRYQDVEELLHAGIDVYTTLNVQDLESLNDVITSITGVSVNERLPDRLFDGADKVTLVDIEPDELLARWQAQPRPDRVYTRDDLLALREIALRRTADRLGRAPTTLPGSRPKAGEHILTCLSASPSNARVIRTAARMAEAFHGSLTALFVENPAALPMDEAERAKLQANMELAEQLGARVSTAYGDDPAIQIAEYVRISGVTKIVMGRSIRFPAFPRSLLRQKTLMDRLSALAPDLDIYIIPDRPAAASLRKRRQQARLRLTLRDLCKMTGILILCTLVGYLFSTLGFNNANSIMVYILGVLCIAMATEGFVYSLLASALSVLVFNFFFTFPYFTLMSDPSYLATFGIMFLVGLFGSILTTRFKRQAVQSAQKAYRTEILLETSQRLQKAESGAAIRQVTATQLNKLLERDVVFYPLAPDGKALAAPELYPRLSGAALQPLLAPAEREAADWVLKNNRHAGATTATLPGVNCLYIAVRGTADRVLAVAGIAIAPGPQPDAFDRGMMGAVIDECGLALERELIRRAKQQVEETARQEALRANLLRAISHDLRTPLTSISGNAGILMEQGAGLTEEKKCAIYTSIYDDALWLINLVENLLSITRIENGGMQLHQEPELLDEVFCEALGHLDREAKKHTVTAHLDDDLLMAEMDARLIVQVVINLVNNAVKYTPAGSHILVSAVREGPMVAVSVADDGPGVPDAAKDKLFTMFYTTGTARSDGRRGLGLGLSLCRTIVSAHGGTIKVVDNPPHGANFIFTLHASEVVSHE